MEGDLITKEQFNALQQLKDAVRELISNEDEMLAHVLNELKIFSLPLDHVYQNLHNMSFSQYVYDEIPDSDESEWH